MSKLSTVLHDIITAARLPGAVGAIVSDNGVKAVGSAGVRKVSAKSSIEANDTVHLGSNGKAMTAILICQLIEQEKLTFATPMSEIFLDMVPKMHPISRSITVRHLLDHTAALPANLEWYRMFSKVQLVQQQRRQVVQEALARGPAYSQKLGEFDYSNTGYVILGAIVEALTGASWESVIQREIFDRLDMKSGGFGVPGGDVRKSITFSSVFSLSSSSQTVDYAHGHVPSTFAGFMSSPYSVSQIDNAPVVGPAGTIHCSVPDWAKFVSEIMSLTRHASEGTASAPCTSVLGKLVDNLITATSSSGGKGSGDGLSEKYNTPSPLGVSASTYRECLLLNNPSQHYAGGFIVTSRPWAGGLALTHTGSNTTWYATVWIAPNNGTAYLAAFNAGGDAVAVAADEAIAKMIALNDKT